MIKKNYIVEKRNILNELRCNNMTLQELRFFTIYLAKIDSRHPAETRKVVFPLSDFLAIMEISKINIADVKQTTNNLLCKVVNIPYETGGYIGFQLFKECRVYKDKNDNWYIEIDANDRALPLMFEFKEQYFTYELWNALRLCSVNQLRMYELLKQYERIGDRVILIDELKKLLFIEDKEYTRFNNFKVKVLDSCQKALKENTDICFEYELIKRGRGGKVREIKFIITKNKNHGDQLLLDEFINRRRMPDAISEEKVTAANESRDNEDDGDYFLNELFPLLAGACQNEFKPEEMQVFYNLMIRIIPYRIGDGVSAYKLKICDYLKRKYDELKLRVTRGDLPVVKSRFGYLKKIIEADLAATLEEM